MTVVDKISIVKQILELFSWKKLFQLISFLFIIGLSFGIYENRQTIYNWVFRHTFAESPQDVKLSSISIKDIDDTVLKSSLIVGIMISVVDFNKNTQTIVYSSIDDESLKKAYKIFQDKNIGELTLFNTNTDNNVRISQLINGKFICTPYRDTIEYKLSPDAVDSVEYVCSNGIPPQYGKFAGIINLYLKKKPNSAEESQLMTLSRDLSSSVFERDFR